MKFTLTALFFVFIFSSCATGRKKIQQFLSEMGTSMSQSVAKKETSEDMNIPEEIQSIKERINQIEADSVSSRDTEALEEAIMNLKSAQIILEERISKVFMVKNQNSELEPSSNSKDSKAELLEEASIPSHMLERGHYYFDQKKWKQAIFTYEEFRKKNSNSKDIKLATLKIAQSFQFLGLKEEALVFLQEVIELFPKSEEAAISKTLMQSK